MNKMKHIFIKLFFFLLAMFLSCTIECKADPADTLYIPVLPIDPIGGNDPIPINAPIHSDIIGYYYLSTSTINFVLAPKIRVAYVNFYRNGILVAIDSTPECLNNSLFYSLSTFGSGIYTIELIAIDDTVYLTTLSF